MIEEREITGLSIPFAVGIAGGLMLEPHLALDWLHPLCCIFFLLIVVLTLALFPLRTSLSISKIHLLASGICLLAGIFCPLNHCLTSGVPSIYSNPLQTLASKAVRGLRFRIATIPYSHPSTSALLNALLTGDKSMLTKETIGVFRESGASHILALSGLHLGLIYLMLKKMTSPIGNSPEAKRLRYLLTVTASFFYCMMTGAGPSISRATIFIFLGETARLLGRKVDSVKVLLATLTIQLATDPRIIMSLGFQLSYLAMTGLLLIYPKMKEIYPEPKDFLWKKIDPFKKIWDAATMSISCQIFTGPLVWLRFKTFPKYFMITNMIALPMTSVIMVLSVTTITLYSLGLCPVFLVELDDQAVQAMIFCLKVIASLDGSG